MRRSKLQIQCAIRFNGLAEFSGLRHHVPGFNGNSHFDKKTHLSLPSFLVDIDRMVVFGWLRLRLSADFGNACSATRVHVQSSPRHR